MKTSYKIAGIAALLFLSGCQSVLDSPTHIDTPTVQISHNDPQWQQHLKQLASISAYKTKGQFGYIDPNERFSSYFEWQYQTPQAFELTMSSNLSAKSLKLQRNRQGMTISDEKGRTRTEQDVNRLVEEIVGVAFPIDQFAYWIKGIPESEGDYIVNEKRQLSQFNYTLDGVLWKVSFVEYHEDRVPNLPKQIHLENGTQTLKVRLDHWTY